MRNLLVIFLIALTLVGLSFSSCNKENDVQPDPTDIEFDSLNAEIPVDSGSIGLVFNARLVAKKGYQPHEIKINFSGNYAKFSKDIPVDQTTQIGILRIDHDDLTTEERNGFADGVPVSYILLDNSDNELANGSLNNQQVDASNTPIIIDTELPEKLPFPSLSPGTPFIIQSETSGKVLTTVSVNSIGFPPYPRGVIASDYEPEGNEYQEFYFEKVEGGNESEYYMLSEGGAIVSGYPMTQSTTFFEPGTVYEIENLIVEPDGEGWVKLRTTSGNYYKELPEGDDIAAQGYAFNEGTENDYTRFRLINADIIWNMIDMGINFNQPILPPARLEFAYSAKLSNCSSAALIETVGRSETRSQSFTTGFEESVELFTSHEASVEVTAGVEVDATFFGKGATYNFEVTAGYEYTTSETNTTTNTWEETESTEIEISRERTVELIPNSAVEVYDAVQSLDNVRVPFTKEFRLKGTDSEGNVIKGKDIQFQLFTNRFDGVITDIGEDYVDFTVKGSTMVDRMLEVETKVEDIDGACD